MSAWLRDPAGQHALVFATLALYSEAGLLLLFPGRDLRDVSSAVCGGRLGF